ncbi:hypothetical protein D6T64_12420 [Cryobacterium melibiosiphilum]|uniref:Uncharacterized protein n=1 Tax=Cryobacterium melibiosiphilum TaxID=995039 RepID=A0A3A5MGD1_9MICO|nr:hypothetical protein [Cryobacterium melibiosiphilum]RJT87901.1 hypothetical protein D6T64_12420 [Cryobacterium melibiosiphilum]
MTTTIRENEKWLEILTIELRLLDVNGTRIGDAVATAREFLDDSGERAEDSLGSPQHYAAELNLPATPEAAQGVRRALVRSGFGVLGMFALVESVVPLMNDEPVTLGPVVLAIYLVALILIALLPSLVPVMARMRRRGVIIGIVTAALLGGTIPALLALWAGDRVLLSLPALPVAIVGAVLLVAPALWGQLRHSVTDDPIIAPGSTPSPRAAFRARLFLVVTNWLLVLGAVGLCAMRLLLETLTR